MQKQMSSRLDLERIKFVISTFDIPPYYIFIVQDSHGTYLFSDVKLNVFEL